MRDTVIRFERVSKRYRLRRGWSARSLREEAHGVVRRLLGQGREASEHFWALRDVDFGIARGETVGFIGPNGAGKSTTLKILSRVTVPTAGRFEANGTVGALIEIGAGFHPDLTGRDNVFLNGAIMGMKRREVEAKFERIVAFAELDRFIDTPIKYYSSGMQVRLGFAVAAHIDPDILLVDEVLAVGDAAFQAKCLNKLAELREREKTVVLVTHNMASVVQHCDRVLWIDHGRIHAEGEPDRVVEEYLRTVQRSEPAAPTFDSQSPLRISWVRIDGGRGENDETIEYGREAAVEIGYEVVTAVEDPVLQVTFQDVRGYPLGGLTTRLSGVKLDTVRPRGRVRLVLTPVLFTRGAYALSVAVLDASLQRFLTLRPSVASFVVEGPSVANREVSGHVVYPHRWDVEGSG
jgi:homopolymeric O-antigen transport system ATP-binding protein